MSISDNEDLDTKPPALKSPPRRVRHRHGSQGSSEEGESLKEQYIKLSKEEQIEISYQRASALLSEDENGGGEREWNGEIVLIPSLVSLSKDFFLPIMSSSSSTAVTTPTTTRAMPSVNFGIAANAASPASFPELTVAPTSMATESSLAAVSSSSAGSSSAIGTTPYQLPMLKPREKSSGMEGGGGGGFSLLATKMQQQQPQRRRRPATPPIGPQGAPIPSHIYDDDFIRITTPGIRRNAPISNSMDICIGNVSTALSNNTGNLTILAPPASPNRVSSLNLNNDAVGLGSASGRLGERLLSNVQLQEQQQQSLQVQHINAVQSLEDAVTRLEIRLKDSEKKNAPAHGTLGGAGRVSGGAPNTPSRGGVNMSNNLTSSTPTTPNNANQQKVFSRHDIDELESYTITQLAEIMLHPPTAMIRSEGGDRFLWEEDASSDVNIRGGVESKENGPEEDVTMDEGNDEENASNQLLLPIQSTATQQQKYPITARTSRYPNSQMAHLSIASLGLSIPRRVCQHPFKRNDIVWVCRTCQSDETCVLCHDCFSHSNHEGHDVAFYHAQAGGCCDCGDADAWDPAGFCSNHGGPNGRGAPPGTAVAAAEPSVCGGVHAAADFLVRVVEEGVEGGYKRANPLLFASGEKKKTGGGGKLGARSDSSLPAYYEESDGGRGRREQQTRRRANSLTRRNTVADVEIAGAERMDTVESGDDEVGGKDNQIATAMSTSSLSELNNNEDKYSLSRSGSVPTTPTPLHELQFDPAAASSSKRWSVDGNSAVDDNKNNSSSDTFDPEAASTSKSASPLRSIANEKARFPEEKTPARALGDLGREQHGLFLVLHADDIHVGSRSPTEVLDALKELYSNPGGGQRSDAAGTSSSVGGNGWQPLPTSNSRLARLRPQPYRREGETSHGRHSVFRAPHAGALLNKIVRLIQNNGDLIVWGTQELLAECGDVIARCWRDGDPTSSSLIGAAMLNRAKILTDRGLVCSIKTRQNLRNEQRANAVIKLIASLAESCDPLCDQVATGISGRGVSSTLPPLVRADLKLPFKFTCSDPHAWHGLLLTLLAQPSFKAALAEAYCDTYTTSCRIYSRGVGILDRSVFTLSVQFLNRGKYVQDLVRDRNLLSHLSRSILESFSLASFVPGSPGSPLPAGASSEMLLDSNNRDNESSSLAAALLALLGYFGGDEDNIFFDLDSQVNDILGGISAGGGDR